MLEIKNLEAQIENKKILKKLNLKIQAGEIHALMGPNGSGKSTLSKVIAGHPDIEESSGEVLFKKQDLLDLDPEERALSGVFLNFQYPIEIPGVNNLDFLRIAYNSKLVKQNKPELNQENFKKLVEEKLKTLNLDNQGFLERDVNSGFSGGEKKRNEVLQMSILEPDFAILDEIDSGLDIDSLRIVSAGINQLFKNKQDKALLVITHYQRLLEYIEPTHVHILYEGRIIKSGGKEIVEQLEKEGYEKLIEENTSKGAKN